MAYYSEKATIEAQAREPKKKQAGFMQNVGTRIAKTVGQQGKNVGNTLNTMFSSPVQGMKQGLKTTVGDLKGHPLLTSMMAASTAMGVNDLRKKEDPSGEGRSRLRRATAFAGEQAGGLIGAPFSLAGGIAGGMMGKKIGDTIGGGIDMVRGYKKKPPAMVASAPVTSAQRFQG